MGGGLAALMRFALGLPKWSMLAGLTVAACVSLNTIPRSTHAIPPASAPVCIDGGGFTRVVKHGGWDTSPEEHAAKMQRAVDALGVAWVEWVAPQDWMCEDEALAATGLTLLEHQRRTTDNYVALMRIAPHLPWLPVLQGRVLADYLQHLAMYAEAGVDLFESERVGVGSVCRRQSTAEGVEILAALCRLGLRVHAFGFKKDGLAALRRELTPQQWANLTADSMAWSRHAFKKRVRIPGHELPGPGRRFGHKSCANCLPYALIWREELLASVERPRVPRQKAWEWASCTLCEQPPKPSRRNKQAVVETLAHG
jgi:hypothetical protein